MNKKKVTINYLLSIVFLFIFQLVYHYFGHGVSSVTMKYAWVIPLIGILWFHFLFRTGTFFSNRLSVNLYTSGAAVLSTGCIVNGVLEIAGSDSPYLVYYWIVGCGFVIAGTAAVFKKEQRVS